MKQTLLVFLIFGSLVWAEVLSCNSCGPECQQACGTRHFRTCCFNYLKKRANPPRPGNANYEPLPLELDPSLRLELWLAKSRNNYFEQQQQQQQQSDHFLNGGGAENELMAEGEDSRDGTHKHDGGPLL